MTVAVSADTGQTFSAPKRVAEDNWKGNGCPDSGARERAKRKSRFMSRRPI